MAYSVSEVNHMAAELFAANPTFNRIEVYGEISGGKLYPSGHYYFTLKDENSTLSCVMFRSAYNRINFTPENGTKVTLTGNATIYEEAGRFQILVQDMNPQGVGDLHRRFELLKAELRKKGYFADQRKKPIPQLPQIIGIATSSAGAVIQDMLHVLRRRFPGFKLHFIPVAVQGETAAGQIAQAINIFNVKNQVDVIVIARGGGSIEDLWAFNEKIVADAIFASEIPVVSAVGHETDFTIADFTADLRAPTPSAAAELIVPEKSSLYQMLEQEQEQLIFIMQKQITDAKRTLTNFLDRPVFTQPKLIIDQKRQMIDEIHNRLFREFKYQTIGQKRVILDLRERLGLHINNILRNRVQEFNNLEAKLNALNPFAILNRGYTYVEDVEGKIIDSAYGVNPDQKMILHWYDGTAEVKATKINLKKIRNEND